MLTGEQLIQRMTEDNSVTLFNEKYQEYYHSIHGALEEAFEKYIKPCRIAEIAKTGKIRILDVCFGLGYTSAAAIEAALESNPECEIEIVGLEIDAGIFDEMKKVSPSLKYYDVIRGDKKNPKINLKILVADARVSIKELTEKFDAVFLIPFSIAVCPELWTVEFLSDIKKAMKPEAILATYSCAKLVRNNLKSAGFIIKDGPAVGRRGPSTIATLK